MTKRLGRRTLLLGMTGMGASLLAGRIVGWPLLNSAPAITANVANASRSSDQQRLTSRTSHALGTKVTISVVHDSPEQAQIAIDAAFHAIMQVERSMSIYRADSEISRLNRDGVLHQPSKNLLTVLSQAQHLAHATDGAFDVTVQPLWSLYAKCKSAGRLPHTAELQAIRHLVDYRQLKISEEAICFEHAGMQITLNGIAQGFAADDASQALQSHGIRCALIDTGELAPLGQKAANQPWRAGIQHPRVEDAYLTLVDFDGRALATSGDYATTFTANHQHHHLLNPKTGDSPTELMSVSIAAPSAMLADAWSTACFVLGPDRALALIADQPQIDALLVRRDGSSQTTVNFPVAKEVL